MIKKILSLLLKLVVLFFWGGLLQVDIGAEEKPIFLVKDLGKIKVHEGGRIKPLDSYAQKILLILNGQSTYNQQLAINWLAKAFFTPQETLDDRIFKITFKEVLFALGIEPDKSRRYTFNQLNRSTQTLFSLAGLALRKNDENRSAFEKEVIRIFQNYNLYRQVLNTFIFTQPIEKFLIENPKSKEILQLANKSRTFSYFELFERRNQLFQVVENLQRKKKPNLKSEEIVILNLYQDFLSFPQSFVEHPIKIFPLIIEKNEKWFSPWEIFFIHTQIKGSTLIFEKIALINNLAMAYQRNNQKEFDIYLDEFIAFIDQEMEKKVSLKSHVWRVNLEFFYNQLDPFYWSSLLYGLGLILILFYLLISKGLFKFFAKFFIGLAFFLNAIGLILRMLISYRPPITNLYETFIFVAFIIVLLCFFLEKYNRKGLGLLSGSLCGLVLLLISNRFISDGDSLAVLVAVLRSNFWLSTHVIAINLGYGGIVLSGVIAHLYLFKRLKKKTNQSELNNISRMIYATQAFGLIFTFLGTMLGGIWADQSWGRFWGWDPKENGALLIVLWSTIIFHARFGGIVRDTGMAVGSVIGIPVVMLAWFGINLLGIGLHSYGFISGVAYSLAAYMLGQFLLLFILLYLIEYRKDKKKILP